MGYLPLTQDRIASYAQECFNRTPDKSQMRSILWDINDLMYMYGEVSENDVIEIIGNIVL